MKVFLQKSLAEAAEGLTENNRGTRRNARERRKIRPAVISYIRAISHNFKEVEERYNVPVVFSVPYKLSVLCKKSTHQRESVMIARPSTEARL